jgi:hypothetical protein
MAEFWSMSVRTRLENEFDAWLEKIDDQAEYAISQLTTITNRGEWTGGSTYKVKDIARYAGTWYICIIAHRAGVVFAADESRRWRVFQGVTTGDLFGLVGTAGTFEDAAALRCVPRPPGGIMQTAMTLGVEAAGDGGGGLWRWDPNSEAIDNLGTVLMPVGFHGSGRWLRVFGGTSDPRWFRNRVNGMYDDTAAILAAQAVSHVVEIPAGEWVVDALNVLSGKTLRGQGEGVTILRQANAGRPALHILSTSAGTAYIRVQDLQVHGMGAAREATDAPAVVVEATGDNVVKYSSFDLHIRRCSTGFRIVCTQDRGNVYSSRFRVFTEHTRNTAIMTDGVYNSFELLAVNCENGKSIQDRAATSTYVNCVADGQIGCDGVNNTWIRPAIETIYADVNIEYAFRIAGYHQVLIDPVITEVATERAAVGFWVNQRATILNPVIWGRQYPDYPFQINDDGRPIGSAVESTIIGGKINCKYRLDQYAPVATLARLNLVGDSSDYCRNSTAAIVSHARKFARLTIDDDSRLSVGIDGQKVASLDGSGTLAVTRLEAGNARFEGTEQMTATTVAAPIYRWSDNNTAGNESQPALCMVAGASVSEPDLMFADLVLIISSTAPGLRPDFVSVVHRSGGSGVAARTYAIDETGSLTVAMSVGEYRVRVTALHGYSPGR